MQVAVFGRNFPSYARENIATMFNKFSMLNVDVWVFEPLFEFLQSKMGIRPRVTGMFTEHKDLPKDLDFLFSLGGDGTFLETVTLVRDSGIPVLGVNIGRLGFLSYISQEDLSDSLDNVFSGKYDIEERMLLQVEASGSALNDLDVALNAPQNKAGATLTYRTDSGRSHASTRFRWVDAFPVESGVFEGNVAAYALLDLRRPGG